MSIQVNIPVGEESELRARLKALCQAFRLSQAATIRKLINEAYSYRFNSLGVNKEEWEEIKKKVFDGEPIK